MVSATRNWLKKEVEKGGGSTGKCFNRGRTTGARKSSIGLRKVKIT